MGESLKKHTDVITIPIVLVSWTKKAFLCYFEAIEKEIWFPRALTKLAADDKSITIPRWLFKSKFPGEEMIK